MKISICASMVFSQDILEIKTILESHGHTVMTPKDTEKHAEGIVTIQNREEKLLFDYIRSYYEVIKNSDAVLVINKTKNNIPNYIGANTLIEMAFAHVLNKKIFLLNPIPDMHHADEIAAMRPLIIKGNFDLIV